MAQRNSVRHRSRSRRNRRGGGKGRIGLIAALIAMPVVTLGAGGYGLHFYMQTERMDERLCYARADQAQAAIYLDYSVNPDLSPAQRRDIRTAALRAYDALPPNGLLMIFTSARDRASSIAAPDFQACRPPATDAELMAINGPSTSSAHLRHVADKARNDFIAMIDAILAETQDADKAARESALLADLQAISRYPGFQGEDRRLVWLSDGLENTASTARFGQVAGDFPPAPTFLKSEAYKAHRLDLLTGMDVAVLLVESITLPQPGLEFATHAELRAFWPAFFELNGAKRARLQILRPVAGS